MNPNSGIGRNGGAQYRNFKQLRMYDYISFPIEELFGRTYFLLFKCAVRRHKWIAGIRIILLDQTFQLEIAIGTTVSMQV